MTEDEKILIQKFRLLKDKGIVESVINYKHGSGITLEKFLGANAGDFPIPDFRDIELKAVREYPYANITLFNSGPDGSYVCSTQWLAEEFGYPDKDYRDINVLQSSVRGTEFNKVGLFYFFSLRIDRKRERIILNIYGQDKKLISEDIYWDFDTLEEKLKRKVSKLAIVDVRTYYSGGKYYFLYDRIRLYHLKSFDIFVDMIEKGIVYITFGVGIVKSGKYKGKLRDHGTSFMIQKNNLDKLFKRIY